MLDPSMVAVVPQLRMIDLSRLSWTYEHSAARCSDGLSLRRMARGGRRRGIATGGRRRGTARRVPLRHAEEGDKIR